MRRVLLVAACFALASAADAAEYNIDLAPKAPDLGTRLRLFADAPVGSAGLFGAGNGVLKLPGSIPASGSATFQKVPVRFTIGGRIFSGRATVTFNNGSFEGLVADTIGSDGPVLTVTGTDYAFDDGTSAVTGRVSAAAGAGAVTPEPSTWATVVIGLGLIGFALRLAATRVVRERA